ncbi:ETX/MTX2 family pore-forming toxin [Spiroplasma endosymbiont of Polydrusus formosus]|uniref:ETX/MTX2 family pore-forming toxin n=1 Tax=Spiroplasma endosymbiont of Polydrusus formosus TaxID=3139326 RepID=UPI0035B56857
MKDEVEKGIHLYYKKQNPHYKIKNISNINLENLIVSNIFIEEIQKNKSFNLEKELESVCKNSESTFINDTDIEQIQYTISCSKQFTETNTIQKMNGFSKSDSTADNKNWSANVNTKITTKASGSAGIPFVTEGKVEVGIEVGGGYTWGGQKPIPYQRLQVLPIQKLKQIQIL